VAHGVVDVESLPAAAGGGVAVAPDMVKVVVLE
jgi:hypothetical protein